MSKLDCGDFYALLNIAEFSFLTLNFIYSFCSDNGLGENLYDDLGFYIEEMSSDILELSGLIVTLDRSVKKGNLVLIFIFFLIIGGSFSTPEC